MLDELYENIIAGSLVLFGWFLNQLGRWFNGRKDDKRQIKAVLHYLMESYFALTRLDPGLIELLACKVKEAVILRATEELTEDEIDTIHKHYKELLQRLIFPLMKSDLEELDESLEDSLKSLALVDPLTAFRLNGHARLVNILEQGTKNTEEYLQTTSNFNDIEEEREFFEYGVNAVRQAVIKEILDELEDNILFLARKVSPIYKIKVRRALKDVKRINTEEYKIELENNIEALFDTVGLPKKASIREESNANLLYPLEKNLEETGNLLK